MSATPIPARSTEVSDAFANVFSTDPELQAIELAFMDRLLRNTAHVNAETLSRGDSSDEASVGATLSMMQSPAFEVIAQELVKALPQGEGFGRFRNSQNKDGPE